jgi:nucleoid-associated protein YgaU
VFDLGRPTTLGLASRRRRRTVTKGINMIEKYQVVSGDTVWNLARRFYGDASLYRVISVHNQLADPDHVPVGQELEIPYVTFRHRVAAGDTTASIAAHYYVEAGMTTVIDVANHVGQRNLTVGEWLLIPDLGNVYHHTVVGGETLLVLAERWYGEAGLWPIIAIPNHLGDQDPPVGRVLIQPQLNRRRTIVAGDTLWNLSRSHYGDHGVAEQVALVAAANHIANPDQIAVGQVVYFPSLWRP